jgi:predicted MFS family arabinose efflux permease
MAAILAGAKNYRVVGLIGSAHGLSHVYYLSLPPLFPLLKEEFGVGYAALGLLMTTFSLISGIGQTPVGFLVDRIGSRGVLTCGLTLQAAAIGAIGFAPSYEWVLVCVAFAGLAHTVYHPADYAILSAAVPRERLGRAFSLHAFSGNVGAAITPAVMVGLTALWSWHAAFVAIGAIGLAVAGLLIVQGGILTNGAAEADRKRRAAKPGGWKASLALLASPPILFAFLFYVIVVSGVNGVRSFSVSAFVDMQGVTLAAANAALTGFMLGSACGILIGGYLADRLGPRLITAVVSLVSCAALFALLGSVSLPVVLGIAALSAAGMMRGMMQATRDLLVFSVTPEGAHGKVYGFVSSGSNLGGAVAPLVFGAVMDAGEPGLVFWLAAILVLVGLATFAGMKRVVDR